MTRIAILSMQPDFDAANAIAEAASKIQNSEVFIYARRDMKDGESLSAQFKRIPDEFDNLSKMHNYIVDDQKNSGFNEILHVVEDTVNVVDIVKLDQMVEDLKNMMKSFSIDLWMNTVTDGMNYVYNKYNPRIVIEFDDPRWQSTNLDGIIFTSHANANWMAYDMSMYDKDLFLFDERFSARMFMIIELLARRRAKSKGSIALRYMNMYPTVRSENGAFNYGKPLDEQQTAEQMKEQNDIFQSLNLDTSPDNLIDNVLENMYNILVKKEG